MPKVLLFSYNCSIIIIYYAMHIIIVTTFTHLIIIFISYNNHYNYIYKRPKKHFKNEKRSKDAAAKKRPNTSGVGKINNYYEDIYIPPYNNTD